MTGTTARAAVVVGVDESEAALAAARWAAEEAVRRDSVLQLFHAGLFDTADLSGRERSWEEPLLLEGARRWIQSRRSRRRPRRACVSSTWSGSGSPPTCSSGCRTRQR
ncbi:universal stress protein [Amycolatopsis sp. NPDC005232]|uniref:universal stress protein n=1 Tax=Amycolatopsis sp. NPDC005232 TaxID=3157027 RepID=UPI0033B51A4E